MTIFDLIHLQPLMNITKGSSRINIGLIDGPVAINHPDLNTKNIIQIKGKQSGTCSVTDSIACNHGTFIAGILKANRGSDAPANSTIWRRLRES